MELKNQINNKISYLDSSLINKLINQILKKGNKYKSFLIMNKVFKYIKKESGLNINPILLITIALNNVKPFIEVKSYKKRNVSLRVPSVISNDRQIALAIKWVIQGAKSRKNKEFAKNLAEAQPTVFLAVPRIWTKFQMGILSKVPQKKLDKLLSIPIVSSFIKLLS